MSIIIVDLDKTPIKLVKGNIQPDGRYVLDFELCLPVRGNPIGSILTVVGTRDHFLPIAQAMAQMPMGSEIIKPGGDKTKPGPDNLPRIH